MKNQSRFLAVVVAIGVAALTACNGSEQVIGTVPEVNNVTVTPINPTVLVGGTVQLTGTVKADSGVQSLAVTWKSEDNSIATVSTTGVVTAVGPGFAVITATSVADPSKSGATGVVVKAPGILTLGVAPASVSVGAGGTQAFNATVTADPGIDVTVTWSSSNPVVASVSPTTGLATGLTAGTASITATSNFDHSHFASGTLIVTAPTFSSINGTYNGAVGFTTNTGTPGTLGTLPSCAGSSTEYNESILFSFNASGLGTATLTDAPSFPRAYSIQLNSSFMGTASGSFPFLGTTVPGWMSMTANGNTVTFRETTQYGACANTYAGTLTKQ